MITELNPTSERLTTGATYSYDEHMIEFSAFKALSRNGFQIAVIIDRGGYDHHKIGHLSSHSGVLADKEGLANLEIGFRMIQATPEYWALAKAFVGEVDIDEFQFISDPKTVASIRSYGYARNKIIAQSKLASLRKKREDSFVPILGWKKQVRAAYEAYESASLSAYVAAKFAEPITEDRIVDLLSSSYNAILEKIASSYTSQQG